MLKPVHPEPPVTRLTTLSADGTLPPVAGPLAPTLGVSREIRRLEGMAVQMGRQWTSVLITGESGVGKEELARVLHQHSSPTPGPFIAVNCGALPDGMMEAELFGYERGAFTGAARAHRGYFEQAGGGTIFLDEIGELTPAAQVRLLRVLQERSLTRLGGERAIRLDYRLITATHRDLREDVRSGRFREDLYYRVNIIQLRVPPLRERPDDVAWLAQLFVERWNQTHPASPRTLSEPALAGLRASPWPGNVRELKHAIERACVLATRPLLGPDDFELHEPMASQRPVTGGWQVAPPAAGQIVPLAEFNRQQERRYIAQVLDHHGGQMTQTAEALGISRKTLWEKTRKLGIKGIAATASPE